MDQDRVREENPNGSMGDKMAEHNYTNTTEDNIVTITRLSPNSSTAKSPPVLNFRNIAPKVRLRQNQECKVYLQTTKTANSFHRKLC